MDFYTQKNDEVEMPSICAVMGKIMILSTYFDFNSANLGPKLWQESRLKLLIIVLISHLTKLRKLKYQGGV